MFSEKHTDIILPSLVLVSWYVSANLGQYHLGFEPKKIPLDLFTKVVTCIIFGFPWDKAFNTNRNEFIIYMLPFKLGVSKLFASFALIVSYHYMVISDNILLCSSSQNLRPSKQNVILKSAKKQETAKLFIRKAKNLNVCFYCILKKKNSVCAFLYQEPILHILRTCFRRFNSGFVNINIFFSVSECMLISDASIEWQ